MRPSRRAYSAGSPLQVDELIDHFRLTRVAQAEPGGVAVLLRIFPETLETGVTPASPFGALRVHFVQVI